MAAKWKIHILTTTDADAPSKKFAFLAPDGQYTGLSATTGVAEATTDGEKSLPLCTVESLLGSPLVVRKTVRYTKAGKTRYGDLVVAVDKADTFATDIVGKTYNGGVVKDAYSPRRASFR
jgi:hypothetical protein